MFNRVKDIDNTNDQTIIPKNPNINRIPQIQRYTENPERKWNEVKLETERSIGKLKAKRLRKMKLERKSENEEEKDNISLKTCKIKPTNITNENKKVKSDTQSMTKNKDNDILSYLDSIIVQNTNTKSEWVSDKYLYKNKSNSKYKKKDPHSLKSTPQSQQNMDWESVLELNDDKSNIDEVVKSVCSFKIPSLSNMWSNINQETSSNWESFKTQ